MQHALLQLNALLVPQDITFQALHASTPAQQEHHSAIVQHVHLQLNALLVLQDITFQVPHASTPVQQERPSPIVQHAVLQHNALLVHQDITFQAQPVLHAHSLAPNAIILLPIALPAQLTLRSQETHAIVLRLA